MHLVAVGEHGCRGLPPPTMPWSCLGPSDIIRALPYPNTCTVGDIARQIPQRSGHVQPVAVACGNTTHWRECCLHGRTLPGGSVEKCPKVSHEPDIVIA